MPSSPPLWKQKNEFISLFFFWLFVSFSRFLTVLTSELCGCSFPLLPSFFESSKGGLSATSLKKESTLPSTCQKRQQEEDLFKKKENQVRPRLTYFSIFSWTLTATGGIKKSSPIKGK